MAGGADGSDGDDTRRVAKPGEFELIARYLAPLATDPGSLALTDDASILTPADGDELVLTKDMLAADVHFFAADPPDAIARKALRVNLSDLASKGARPVAYLLGLGLPRDWEPEWLGRFCAGLAEDQASYGVVLHGGDTIRSGDGLLISVTAIGTLPAQTAVRRSGARAGDAVYVTGTIGDAALGLRLRLDPALEAAWGLSPEEAAHLRARYLLPQPRTGAAPVVRAFASAAMDISDGLTGDLAKLLAASQAGAEIDLPRIPLSPAAARACGGASGAADGALATALGGGDDYELLMTVPPERAPAFEAAMAKAGVAATRIGRITAPHVTAGRAAYLDAAGRALDLSPGGYSHF